MGWVKKLSRFTVLLICLLAFTSAFGQNDRMEIPVRHNSETPYVVSADNSGFYLLLDRSKDGEGDRSVYLAKYDTNFKQVWEDDVPYARNLPFRDLKVFDENLYVLFQNPRKDLFEIIRVGRDEKEPMRIGIRHLSGFEYTDFLVFRDQCYFIGQLGNQAMAFRADLATRKVTPIPMAFRGKNIKATHISFSKSSIMISVSFEDRRQRINVIREIDPFTGKTINDLVMKPDGQYDLISAQGNVIDGNETVVIGTYAMPNSEFTQGFYFSKMAGQMELSRQYHSFTDLNNFFSFLNDNTEQKLKSKAKRKKSKGKDLKVRYRLLAHEIIKKDDEYLMVGEAYYPTFRTERVNTFYRGMRVYDYVQVFDGWRYTHATVAGFDENGNLKWDQSFEIDDTKLFRLQERISVCEGCDDISIAYNMEGQVKIAKVVDGNLIQATDNVVSGDSEVVRQASLGDSEYWYDKYFLFWGYQKISDKSSEGKNRKIFYINKVSF